MVELAKEQGQGSLRQEAQLLQLQRNIERIDFKLRRVGR
jgi:hypothetical protein